MVSIESVDIKGAPVPRDPEYKFKGFQSPYSQERILADAPKPLYGPQSPRMDFKPLYDSPRPQLHELANYLSQDKKAYEERKKKKYGMN